MGILDRAKAHYETASAKCRIEIAEWGENKKQPLVVTWTPLTVHDRRRIYEPEEDGKAPGGGTVIIRTVIRKACDAEGKKLFDEMAENDLVYKVDSNIIGRIANAILYGVGVEPGGVKDQVAAEKNG